MQPILSSSFFGSLLNFTIQTDQRFYPVHFSPICFIKNGKKEQFFDAAGSHSRSFLYRCRRRLRPQATGRSSAVACCPSPWRPRAARWSCPGAPLHWGRNTAPCNTSQPQEKVIPLTFFSSHPPEVGPWWTYPDKNMPLLAADPWPEGAILARNFPQGGRNPLESCGVICSVTFITVEQFHPGTGPKGLFWDGWMGPGSVPPLRRG